MKRILPVLFSLFLLPATSINLLTVAAPKKAIVAQAIDPGLKNQIQQHTVTVVNGDRPSELGVLLGKQNDKYLVLTSQTVISGNNTPTIQTSDGQVHQANVVSDATTINTNFSLSNLVAILPMLRQN